MLYENCFSSQEWLCHGFEGGMEHVTDPLEIMDVKYVLQYEKHTVGVREANYFSWKVRN